MTKETAFIIITMCVCFIFFFSYHSNLHLNACSWQTLSL